MGGGGGREGQGCSQAIRWVYVLCVQKVDLPLFNYGDDFRTC